MLTQLTIHNFAIVKFLELELQAGMTSITGETGAGKSIAIDALGLALGGRAEASMIRPGSDKTEISARFNLQRNPPARHWLQQQELEMEEECLLRRVITAEGRSRAYINGTPVPLAQLKALGQLLINIHGQHAHQLLMRPEQQLAILDAYAAHGGLLDEVRQHHQHWRQQQQALLRLQQEADQRQARQQLLEYQVQELDDFALQEGEFAAIEAEHSRLANSGALVADCQYCLDGLYDSDEFTVLGQLKSLIRRLEQMQSLDPALQPALGLLQEAQIQLDEGYDELRHYLDRLEPDPERFAELESRLSKSLDLARKHQIKPTELVSHHAALQAELNDLLACDEQLDSLQASLQASLTAYQDAANRLSASRVRHAQQLGGQISTHMQQLNMPQGKLIIEISPVADRQPSPLGQDLVQFQVSTNPGQPLQPLAKVASGGELSRISLAIQVITAERIATPSLIFDEVDVGISGPTAAVVGRLLRQLGQSTQVLVVTHLPQVAGQGHHHFLVAKQHDGQQTETNMAPLDLPGRLGELARLLGGDQITDNTLANARELLAQDGAD